MATLTTSLLVMRWELLSAVMMFFASTMKIKFRRNSNHLLAFACGGVGLGMSCWFVTGLLGITLSMETLNHMVDVTKTSFVNVMSMTPATWPMP
ncbi:YjcB family protein [Pantoea sp. A4]|uniref:YjcB family protein n=1 Tax=Pantoea sp. A4 TaxID=1225184 RepID=UPI00035DA313|nr:YjcB family protein [Pantoea sp. A4]